MAQGLRSGEFALEVKIPQVRLESTGLAPGLRPGEFAIGFALVGDGDGEGGCKEEEDQ